MSYLLKSLYTLILYRLRTRINTKVRHKLGHKVEKGCLKIPKAPSKFLKNIFK